MAFVKVLQTYCKFVACKNEMSRARLEFAAMVWNLKLVEGLQNRFLPVNKLQI